MVKQSGITRINDDEWYTPAETADKIAEWLATTGNLKPKEAYILCPADILPDGSESTLPQALRRRGFQNIRVTRDLPLDALFADYQAGEVIVTNPPFSLLCAFRKWLYETQTKYCILSRPGCVRGFPVIETGSSFYSTDGRGVATAWMQNLADTRKPVPDGLELGNCADCERKACPRNAMTGGWTPGRPRKLYGWCHAVKHGINGSWCQGYTTNGRKAFLRFFDGSPLV